jgi:hypothetical protein
METVGRKRKLIMLMLLWIGSIIVGGFISTVYFSDYVFLGRFVILLYASLMGGYIFRISGVEKS